MRYELYGWLHKTAKYVLKRDNRLPNTVKLVSFPKEYEKDGCYEINKGDQVNEIYCMDNVIKKDRLYPVENLVNAELDPKYPLSFVNNCQKIRCTNNLSEASNLWKQFIELSAIPDGYRNAGLHYAGYIKECSQWCLPSWIWTNAALVRMYCLYGEISKAEKLGNFIINLQTESGGWIVRNDYTREGVAPQLAPNDSCYIGLNCCIELYKATNKKAYLESAIKVAEWVMNTARTDGMVWFSFDTKQNIWIKDRNIVDTGFTAGLFASLYEITHEDKYIAFLRKFVETYIELFYMPNSKCFATAIDGNDSQHGGAFGRGQGWALEGLIPAYSVLKDEKIKNVIESTIDTVLNKQLKNGGWSYNLLNPLMGEDCKAVPVIARCLLEWAKIDTENERLRVSAKRALKWCVNHTAQVSVAAGGIFSYTIEGAIVHHMYTNTAFVYSSSYALEVQKQIGNLTRGKR